MSPKQLNEVGIQILKETIEEKNAKNLEISITYCDISFKVDERGRDTKDESELPAGITFSDNRPSWPRFTVGQIRR